MLFDKLFKGIQMNSPACGEAIPLSQVPDPTFAEEMIGKGAAIRPSSGEIYAPCDGQIALVFDTLHAIAMTSDFGAEIMIHVGLDTVELKGEPFEVYVKQGQSVKQGELLMKADLEKIKASGKDTVIPVLITNPDDFSKISCAASGTVNKDSVFLQIKK